MSNHSGTELVALLGKPFESVAVERLLRELAVEPVRDADYSLVDVSAPRCGLDITFKPAERLRDAQALGVAPDCLVTSVVFFHAGGHEHGYSGYSGVLPYQLHFSQSRAAVHALLGAPSGSSTKHKNDRWNVDPLYLTIDFADDEQSIQLVTVGLPWKPRRGVEQS